MGANVTTHWYWRESCLGAGDGTRRPNGLGPTPRGMYAQARAKLLPLFERLGPWLYKVFIELRIGFDSNAYEAVSVKTRASLDLVHERHTFGE